MAKRATTLPELHGAMREINPMAVILKDGSWLTKKEQGAYIRRELGKLSPIRRARVMKEALELIEENHRKIENSKLHSITIIITNEQLKAFIDAANKHDKLYGKDKIGAKFGLEILRNTIQDDMSDAASYFRGTLHKH